MGGVSRCREAAGGGTHPFSSHEKTLGYMDFVSPWQRQRERDQVLTKALSGRLHTPGPYLIPSPAHRFNHSAKPHPGGLFCYPISPPERGVRFGPPWLEQVYREMGHVVRLVSRGFSPFFWVLGAGRGAAGAERLQEEGHIHSPAMRNTQVQGFCFPW